MLHRGYFFLSNRGRTEGSAGNLRSIGGIFSLKITPQGVFFCPRLPPQGVFFSGISCSQGVFVCAVRRTHACDVHNACRPKDCLRIADGRQLGFLFFAKFLFFRIRAVCLRYGAYGSSSGDVRLINQPENKLRYVRTTSSLLILRSAQRLSYVLNRSAVRRSEVYVRGFLRNPFVLLRRTHIRSDYVLTHKQSVHPTLLRTYVAHLHPPLGGGEVKMSVVYVHM